MDQTKPKLQSKTIKTLIVLCTVNVLALFGKLVSPEAVSAAIDVFTAYVLPLLDLWLAGLAAKYRVQATSRLT